MRILNFLKNNNDKHKSIRVNTEIGDKFINVNLDQTYESMDILSLKIFQKDVYRLFDADYGIIVGRVLGQGVGIPNCKISVFIPIDETTTTNPTTLEDIKKIQAAALYPYQTVFDKDGNGKIYNLLPKYSRNRNVNGFPDNDYGIGATPKTPVGTFPEKDEILVNETVAYVYDKYYKYTTVTNESGDYILTVPSNRNYTVTMCCDITDIGRFSTCAALLKLDGYPDNFFTADGLNINDEIPLELLPNIDIQNVGLTVRPLWSQDPTNTNVGINRLDFNLNKKVKPFVTIIGNQFTQNSRAWWGDKIQFRFLFGIRALCFTVLGVKVKIPGVVPFIDAIAFVRKMCTLNGGKGDYEPFEFKLVMAVNECTRGDALNTITEGLTDDIMLSSHVKGNLDIKLFNIKNTIPEEDADLLNQGANSALNNYSHTTDIELLSTKKYITYQNNGSFINLINCNRNKVITNENGDLIPVDNNSEKGVFISFRGYYYLTNLSDVTNPPTRYRVGKVRLKVPQSFDYSNDVNKWIWKHFKFDFGKIYSVAQKTVVRGSEWNAATEGEDDYAEGSAQSVGFASQTNLLLIGEKEENFSFNSIIPNDNTEYPNYINFYNHIVNLGEDSNNLVDDGGDVANTEAQQNTNLDTTPPDPTLYGFEFSIEGDAINNQVSHTYTISRSYPPSGGITASDIVINNILIENTANPTDSSYNSFSYFIEDTITGNQSIIYSLNPTTYTSSLPVITLTKSQITVPYFGNLEGPTQSYTYKLYIRNDVTGVDKSVDITLLVI